MQDDEILDNQGKIKENDNQDLIDATQVDDVLALKDKIAALEDQVLRTCAEVENTRRRHERTLDETKNYAISNFAKDLLSVMDNFERALGQKYDDDPRIANIIAGVEMTKRELESVFKKYGLESISPLPKEKFDYNIHHAVSQVVTDEYNHDTIINTMQVGYKIKDRLLRPAIVTVAKKADE